MVARTNMNFLRQQFLSIHKSAQDWIINNSEQQRALQTPYGLFIH